MEENSFFYQMSFACKKTYEGILKKQKIIKDNVIKIDRMIVILCKNPYIFNEKWRLIIEIQFFTLCEDIYSCLDYYSYILRHYQSKSDKYRGQKMTKAKFNDVLSGYKQNKDKLIYKGQKMNYLLMDASLWYPKIHDIRSKEIHCCMGRIDYINEQFYYYSNTEYGEYGAITFNISEIKEIHYRFQRFMDDALKAINENQI